MNNLEKKWLFLHGVISKRKTMGGEGHMLDMIKRMELNRQQLKNARNSFYKGAKKPPISIKSSKDGQNFNYLQKGEKLTSKQKQTYRIIAVIFLVCIVAGFATLLIFYLTMPMSFLYGR